MEREFVRAALKLASRPEVDRLIFVSDVPLATSDLRGRPIKRKLVYAVTSEQLAHALAARQLAASRGSSAVSTSRVSPQPAGGAPGICQAKRSRP